MIHVKRLNLYPTQWDKKSGVHQGKEFDLYFDEVNKKVVFVEVATLIPWDPLEFFDEKVEKTLTRLLSERFIINK